MKKICILGYFGYQTNQLDGQTIKTRNLYDLVKKNIATEICYYDTEKFKYNKLSIVNMFFYLVTNRILFYLPAHNNLLKIFPIIYCLSRIFRFEIHYFVVGGWLKEFLEDKPWHRKMLSKISGIHCETELMKTLLEKEYGFKNVDTFPNFRINSYKPTLHHEEGKLKLVFMARVNKMKGLDTIFSACDKIKDNCLSEKINIDFYGPLQDLDNDIEYFNTNITKYNFVKYNGPAEPSEIYGILEKYDAMLLPTHYYTEGLPGSVIDAYMSGIPVVVTKWKHATEFVDDEKTGLIIPFDDDGTELYDAVLRLLNNQELLSNMKSLSQKKGYDFSSDKAWELLQKYLND